MSESDLKKVLHAIKYTLGRTPEQMDTDEAEELLYGAMEIVEMEMIERGIPNG